jgi:hypothetical protein
MTIQIASYQLELITRRRNVRRTRGPVRPAPSKVLLCAVLCAGSAVATALLTIGGAL